MGASIRCARLWDGNIWQQLYRIIWPHRKASAISTAADAFSTRLPPRRNDLSFNSSSSLLDDKGSRDVARSKQLRAILVRIPGERHFRRESSRSDKRRAYRNGSYKNRT